ncbi:hydroxymethylbilane synthase [Ichthyenterobacterium sp. W332]|uniref:Hydroxymethylbilane synthase n=1 Tax=Microcosmobacter mediterraneus TaxID=3075607 RepID=A0ABU2YI27_9FLAO|nr:hydroxymethylbilane synthase [Ichthyenterobacterium sp. W332]MDT0557806.1 hydroxymethylbilane synthase [Ichthyenterobacterium sp. W332]
MSKVIRIGTRDSKLAQWQANAVQNMLVKLGHESVLVPIKSSGDIIQDKPLYQLGITGIFTKALDIALLNEEIDIAVHSFKDVPTILPNGIIQAAVLKRGNVNDLLVFKKNEEFLSQREAVIATGSLRRRAQWLNRYPTHTTEDLRGNVNTRLQKLDDNEHWNAAIFAAAGIGRLGLMPENSVKLDWMIPAPAQGAIMIATLDDNEAIKEVCAELNHEETEICTSIERKFLNLLEGGCTAPIGALAFIKDEEVNFKGILLSKDGTKKIEVEKVEKLGNHHDIAEFCSNFIIERGGKVLIDTVKSAKKDKNVYSTKLLTESQRQLFNETVGVESSNFIKISSNRIKPSILKAEHNNVIITSKNGVEAIVENMPKEDLRFHNIYCVGRRTKKLIEQKIGPVKHSERNAKRLAEYLSKSIKGEVVTYFCSNLRLDDLPKILNKGNVIVNEVEAYKTRFDALKLKDKIDGALFYSPSTVESFVSINRAYGVAFCIGESTAKVARQYFKNIEIAKVPTVESVIDLVNDYYMNS